MGRTDELSTRLQKEPQIFFVTKQENYLMTSEEITEKESTSFSKAQLLKGYLCGWYLTKQSPES